MIRKRIVPVQYFSKGTVPPTELSLDTSLDLIPELSVDIKFGTKKVGKVLGGAHNVGLALVRLEYLSTRDMVFDLQVSDELCARAFAPVWWPQTISA